MIQENGKGEGIGGEDGEGVRLSGNKISSMGILHFKTPGMVFVLCFH
jgi:hypothetical protein